MSEHEQKCLSRSWTFLCSLVILLVPRKKLRISPCVCRVCAVDKENYSAGLTSPASSIFPALDKLQLSKTRRILGIC